jgi:hypothetical protein
MASSKAQVEPSRYYHSSMMGTTCFGLPWVPNKSVLPQPGSGGADTTESTLHTNDTTTRQVSPSWTAPTSPSWQPPSTCVPRSTGWCRPRSHPIPPRSHREGREKLHLLFGVPSIQEPTRLFPTHWRNYGVGPPAKNHVMGSKIWCKSAVFTYPYLQIWTPIFDASYRH